MCALKTAHLHLHACPGRKYACAQEAEHCDIGDKSAWDILSDRKVLMLVLLADATKAKLTAK